MAFCAGGEAAPLPEKTDLRRNAIVRTVEKVGPAVVNINTEESVRERPFPGWGGSPFDDFFRDFFESFPEREYKRQSLGSGVIIDAQGYILTNEHVIARASSIKVSLIDQREFEAQLIGADPGSDLAVIKIAAPQSLPFVQMGRSDDLLIGETIIAIGNPFGLSHTVTTGVISALQRSLKDERGRIFFDFIQLDASINPGNSGGPLLNIHGELIGINTAIYQQAQGIGFAIPIDKARHIVKDLIAYGEVQEVWLGVRVADLTGRRGRDPRSFQGEGVVVSRVFQGSPADNAGLRPGDIIRTMRGRKVKGKEDYLNLLSMTTPREAISLTLSRQGKERKATLIAQPIPPGLADRLAQDLLGFSAGEVSPQLSRRLGLDSAQGVLVRGIVRDSPAGKIGIEPGDVIRQVNKLKIGGMKDFRQAVLSLANRDSVLLLVQRGRYAYYVTLDL